jgi:hypothetical protein
LHKELNLLNSNKLKKLSFGQQLDLSSSVRVILKYVINIIFSQLNSRGNQNKQEIRFDSNLNTVNKDDCQCNCIIY